MDYQAHTLRMAVALVLISENARYWLERGPENCDMRDALQQVLDATKGGLGPYVAERRAEGSLPPASINT